MHHFRYEHGSACPQTAVRLLLLILLVLAVEIVTLAVEAPALIRHFAGDPELFRHRSVQLFARFVHDFRPLDRLRRRGGVALRLQSRLNTKHLNILITRQSVALNANRNLTSFSTYSYEGGGLRGTISCWPPSCVSRMASGTEPLWPLSGCSSTGVSIELLRDEQFDFDILLWNLSLKGATFSVYTPPMEMINVDTGSILASRLFIGVVFVKRGGGRGDSIRQQFVGNRGNCSVLC